MDLQFTPQDDVFRAEVRRFFETEYPQAILKKLANGQTLDKADYVTSQQALNAKGWLAPNWPSEFGGAGWTAVQRFIFDEELERAGAPSVNPMSLLYVAPIIFTFGTDEQKRRWLPDILSSKTFWGQGYSEPEAGSDLASLQMRAVRDGDDYVVNGTKTWTSSGHHADWIFCLVRTSTEAKKQDGITFLCIDMKSPGIQVRPIITIDGGHHLSQITFENVRTSVDNRIGQEGMGWTYSRHLLGHERTSYAHVAGKRRQLDAIKALAQDGHWGGSAADLAAFQRKIAATEAKLSSLEFTTLRALAPLAAGQAPSDESSILKIMATELAQEITELGLELVGPYGAIEIRDRRASSWRDGLEMTPAYAVPMTADYFLTRAQSIYGGTNEIQRNIIYRMIAG